MKKEIIFLMCLLFILNFIVAQNLINEDITISEGDVIISDYTIEDITLSTTLGGIISQIQQTIGITVELAGIPVWINGNISLISDFTLFAFTSGVGVDFGEITTGEVFETSEEVEVRGVSSIWVTYNTSSLATGTAGLNDQPLLDISDTFVFSPTESITLNNYDDFNNRFEYDIIVDGTLTTTTKNGMVCTGTQCPTFQQIIDYFEVTPTAMYQAPNFINPNDQLVLIKHDGTFSWIARMDNSVGDWEFGDLVVVEGYQVSSSNGQSLILLPATETFDIYAII